MIRILTDSLSQPVVVKLAGDNVRPEERVAVQRRAGECTIFGQYVYKDENDGKSSFVKKRTHD